MASLNDNIYYTEALRNCETYKITDKLHKISDKLVDYLKNKADEYGNNAFAMNAALGRLLLRLLRAGETPFQKEFEELTKKIGSVSAASYTLSMGVLKKLEKMGEFVVSESNGEHEITFW